jgi:predicted nucleic acid-binding protein
MTAKLLVDTNVVSEMMHPQMHPAVGRWLDRMEASNLFLASTSLAELRFGIAILPPGRRMKNLSSTLDHLLASLFQGRILAFDAATAEEYAMIVSRARLRGRPIEIADGQIAAIAAVHGFAVATRDMGPFEAAGVAVVNPWEGA